MHLTFLSNLYPPYVVGGNEMLCDEVVTALRARGHRASVICGRGRDLPDHPDVRGVLEIDLDRKDETFLGGRQPTPWETFKLHLYSPSSAAATRRALDELRPDVVIAWNLYLASLAPMVAARQFGAPLITHVCDKWLHFMLGDLEPLLGITVPWKRAAARLTQAAVGPWLRRAVRPDPIVAISDFMRDIYVGAGFAPGTVDVEHLGVPTDQFTYTPRAEKAPGEAVRLLYAGGMWEGKGPQTAVRALGRLVRSGADDVHLDMCGSGAPHFVAWLEEIIAEEGVAEHVTLHGFVDRATVRAFCQSHDVLVFPSQWDEPFAAVPVEAMSCGMAIAATTAGGTPEAIVDGETGLLVPPADPDALAAALGRLVADGALRRRLGAEAARVARARFDFEGYVDRLEAYYAAQVAAAASR